MVYREFFMDTMQMVVAIPLCFGSLVHHLWRALLCKIHTNTDEYWVDVITRFCNGLLLGLLLLLLLLLLLVLLLLGI